MRLIVLRIFNLFFLSFDLHLRRVLNDVGGELVAHVHGEDVAAGLAGRSDHVLLDLK